ncbi:MAG: hypothetical protein GC182_22095 [Rhodopseudomonas sp.]|nr:hypothetical protein [Rhodopseudomonas sp.]
MDREDVAELFREFGPVSVRRVFSGFGVYADEVCFSLYLRGELYLRADAATAPRFAAEGSTPFSYAQARSGKVIVVNSYWRLPERLYDDPEDLAQWARIALGVARSTAAKKTRPARKADAGSGGTVRTAKTAGAGPLGKARKFTRKKSVRKKPNTNNPDKNKSAGPSSGKVLARPGTRKAAKTLARSTKPKAKKARTKSRR